jgi:hypothetical protein
MLNYMGNVAVAFDQFVNALCGGSCDESISAHAYRLHRDDKPMGWLMPVINCIFFWQDNHCRNAFDRERARFYLPTEYH